MQKATVTAKIKAASSQDEEEEGGAEGEAEIKEISLDAAAGCSFFAFFHIACVVVVVGFIVPTFWLIDWLTVVDWYSNFCGLFTASLACSLPFTFPLSLSASPAPSFFSFSHTLCVCVCGLCLCVPSHQCGLLHKPTAGTVEQNSSSCNAAFYPRAAWLFAPLCAHMMLHLKLFNRQQQQIVIAVVVIVVAQWAQITHFVNQIDVIPYICPTRVSRSLTCCTHKRSHSRRPHNEIAGFCRVCTHLPTLSLFMCVCVCYAFFCPLIRQTEVTLKRKLISFHQNLTGTFPIYLTPLRAIA